MRRERSPKWLLQVPLAMLLQGTAQGQLNFNIGGLVWSKAEEIMCGAYFPAVRFKFFTFGCSHYLSM
jgi:hypothetical protein